MHFWHWKKHLLPVKLRSPSENCYFITELLHFIRHLDFSCSWAMIVLNFQVFRVSVVHSYGHLYVCINLSEIASSL